MTEDIRFTFGANENWEDILIDHLEGKGYLFYEIDVLCNELWEQIKQFEKFNQELSEENKKLKNELSEKDIQLDYLQSENKHMRDLVNENNELKEELTEQVNRKDACLKTAHSFHIKNEKLEQEVEQLKQENLYLKSDKVIQDSIKEVGYRISQQESLERQNNQLVNENKELKQLQDELYDFRLVYNALLFNEWHKKTLIKILNHDDTNLIKVYKSRRHYDGSIPFNDPEWFIVVAILPSGKQITNHYHIDYWDYFKIPEKEKVEHEFDEHTSQDVLKRLKEELKQ